MPLLSLARECRSYTPKISQSSSPIVASPSVGVEYSKQMAITVDFVHSAVPLFPILTSMCLWGIGSYKRDCVRYASQVENHRNEAFADERLSPRRLIDDRLLDRQPNSMLYSPFLATFRPVAAYTTSRGSEHCSARSPPLLQYDDVTIQR